MESNISQAEAMKTCFGILAIMSRDDANKGTIAKDGMEVMLNAMTAHIDRTDVQEAGCDLLWSLAFNSGVVKEIISKCNGAVVLVRALKRHTRSPDFLKSACGALSNICQFKANQEAVASQGGLQPLVGSIHIHQTNAKLLPFIFDAIASIIVNNEENARTVSSLGIIPVGVATLSRHKQSREVVKSGCHTLAILSDVKGQASKIAFAGGVPVILSLLDLHPLYSDLHRVAAVVLLRMLQESSHVGREICCHEGVRILLFSLEKGGAQQDTVAAVTHILYSITNPNSPAVSTIESQLWSKNGGDGSATTSSPSPSPVPRSDNMDVVARQTSLVGVVTILGQYSQRRDVVRAACRLITNLSNFSNVILALDGLNVLEKVLDCISIHRDTKDVLEAAVVIIKGITRWRKPRLRNPSSNTIQGLLHLFESRLNDEDVVTACADMCKGMLEDEQHHVHSTRAEEHEAWYLRAVSTCLIALNMYGSSMTKLSEDHQLGKSPSMTNIEHPRTVGSLADFLFLCLGSDNLSFEDNRIKEVVTFLENWSQRNEPERMNMFIFLEEKLRKRTAAIKLLQEHQNKEGGGTSPKSTGNTAMAAEKSQDTAGSSSTVPTDVAASSNTTTGQNHQQTERVMSRASSVTSVSNHAHTGTQRHVHSDSSNHHTSSSNGHHDEGKSGDTSTGFDHMATVATVQGRLVPLHPCKESNQQASAGTSGGRGGTNANHTIKTVKLLDNWPNYLERLLSNSLDSQIRFSSQMQDRDVPTRMHLVYESLKPGGKSLVSRCPTPIPYHVPSGGMGPAFAHSLTFDSEFDTGNLYRAIQVGDATYDLLLRADMHTQGHTQWFYFAVANTHPPELVRLAEQGVQVPSVRVSFNLINFTKPDSLFNLGMRPVVYSVTDAKQKGVGWVRSGTDISYYGNNFVRTNNNGEGSNSYFTLTFTLEFHHPKDTVLIAYSYPYTMSDYKQQIRSILDRPRSELMLRRFKLCTTLAGEDCDLLAITDFSDGRDKIGPLTFTEAEYNSFDENAGTTGTSSASTAGGGGSGSSIAGGKMRSKEIKALEKARQNLKPALFLSARVHPGETPASWMMKGIIEFLTSDNPAAQQIRKLFVVFIVPILNPDGVTFGNNRCSLAGVDLNRQWKIPVRHMHPTVYYFKMFMFAQKKVREVSMYVDLHGHSRKYNVFMYGCDDKKRPKPQVRAFPKFLSNHHIGGKYVCFADCSFHVKKGRESTARVVVAKEMNIPCSFTLEATFCGSNYGPLKNCHMNIGHLQEVGAALVDSFLNFAISEGFGKECLSLSTSVSTKNYLNTYGVEAGGSSLTSMMASLTTSQSSAALKQHQQGLSTDAATAVQRDTTATGTDTEEDDDGASLAGGEGGSKKARNTASTVTTGNGAGIAGTAEDNEMIQDRVRQEQNAHAVDSDSEDSDTETTAMRTPSSSATIVTTGSTKGTATKRSGSTGSVSLPISTAASGAASSSTNSSQGGQPLQIGVQNVRGFLTSRSVNSPTSQQMYSHNAVTTSTGAKIAALKAIAVPNSNSNGSGGGTLMASSPSSTPGIAEQQQYYHHAHHPQQTSSQTNLAQANPGGMSPLSSSLAATLSQHQQLTRHTYTAGSVNNTNSSGHAAGITGLLQHHQSQLSLNNNPGNNSNHNSHRQLLLSSSLTSSAVGVGNATSPADSEDKGLDR